MTSRKLLGSILRDVSRSFYVSIRLLPRRLREPVKLAYLLARATDTIADTEKIPTTVRADALRKLADAIQDDAGANEIVDLSESFASLQTNAAEQKLIEALPQCFEMLALMNVADLADIREVLAKITRGQTLDVERPVLAQTSELHEYTYLVAGCVGEFWTHLCFRYIDNFADQSEERMLELGKAYGQGLQLVNILRDTHVDLAQGRCYFPEEELQAIGLSPDEILQKPEQLAPIYDKWLAEAGLGLESGMEYVRVINHARVRGATVLPALIGARTLSMLLAAGANALRERIKVPRAEVRAMIATVALTLAKRKTLDEMFARYRK